MPVKRLIPSLLAFALVATACSSQPPPAELEFKPGRQFIPQVVDFTSDVGRSPSIALDSEGSPVLTYLGFAPILEPGELPELRPVSAPRLPGVLFADQTEGIWNHGAVVEEDEDLVEPVGEDEVPPPFDGAATAIAADSNGTLHVIYTDRSGLQYSTDGGTGLFERPQRVAGGDVYGASIAVDSSGNPWVAYYRGQLVEVSTLVGGRWDDKDVLKAAPCGDCPTVRTAIAAGSAGPIVAYTSGNSLLTAELSGDEWTIRRIPQGGSGVSMTVDDRGDAHLAFYSREEEVVYARAGANQLLSESVGRFSSAENPVGWSTGIAIDDKGTVYIAWHEGADDRVHLSSGKSGDFKEIPTPGTEGGTWPSVAVAPDGSMVWVAWYDHINEDLQLGTYGEAEEIVIAQPSPSPTEAGPAPPPETAECEPKGATVKAVASTGAVANGFGQDCLAAVADKSFNLVFDNGDTGVPHNLSVYTDSGASDQLATSGPPVPGPEVQKAKAKPIEAGDYFFQCDVHPTTMNGAFVVR
ncbi:MAG: hypothetical protein WD276_00590 [Actinomycetota bacterium]